MDEHEYNNEEEHKDIFSFEKTRNVSQLNTMVPPTHNTTIVSLPNVEQNKQKINYDYMEIEEIV